jgi:hypothetical protein
MMKKNRHFVYSMWIILLALFAILTSAFSSDTAAASTNPKQKQLENSFLLPSATPTVASYRFTKSSLNGVKPSDILKELYYGGKGGGAGESVCDDRKLFSIGNIGYHNEAAQGQLIYTNVCGWMKDEVVRASLIDWRGKVVLTQRVKVWADDESGKLFGYYAVFSTIIPIDAQPGTYKVLYQGKSGRAETAFKVAQLKGPSILYQGRNQVMLANFRPYENVRLIAYAADSNDDKGIFAGWSKFQTVILLAITMRSLTRILPGSIY